MDLLDKLPTSMPDLFALEWHSVLAASQNQVKRLALLAHDRNKHTLSDLALLFHTTTDEIRASLDQFTFLSVPTGTTDEVEFVSDTYRRYASHRLDAYKAEVNELIIDSLLQTPDSDQALTLLPIYLQDSGRDEALLSYLSPEHLGKMLEKSQSPSPVQLRARLGVETALRLRRDEDLTRLGIDASVLAELDDFQVSRSEIEARFALGDLRSCINLAQSAVVKDDRLRLLALVARKMREKGAAPESELLDQIEQLAKEVDFTSFKPERAVELATDLIHANPELAIIVLEKTADRGAATKEGSLDWALAMISLQAVMSGEQEIRSTAETFKTRIKDPDVKKFSAAAAMLFGSYSGADVIAEIDKIKHPERKLTLLRHWAMNASNEPNAAEIVEYAINLGVKTTEYSPNATHLRELATPLPSITDADAIRRLIPIFDSQRATVQAVGPTDDFVRLQLTLAEAEAKHDFEAARRRIEEVYLFISYLGDLAIKAGCIARLTAALVRLDPHREFEAANKIHSLSDDDLKADVRLLLDSTGQHNMATRRVIEALSSSRPQLALEICLSLNIQVRRDSALRSLLSNILREPAREIPLSFVSGLLDHFADSSERDEAVTEVVERFAILRKLETLEAVADGVVPILGRVAGISSAEQRTRAASLALQVIKRVKRSANEGLEAALETTLTASWESMDDDWRKVEAAFDVTSAMAICCRPLALEYLKKAEALRDRVTLESPNLGYGVAMRLAVRAYAGVLAMKLEAEEDLPDLAGRIDRLPSLTSRILLWTDVALRLVSYSRIGEAREIVEKHLLSLLTQLEQKNPGEWCEYMVECAPALHVAHAKSALEAIGRLPLPWRDSACQEVADFICRKVPSEDPYQGTAEVWYRLTYNEISDLIDVLELSHSDGFIHECTRRIVDTTKKQKPPFSQQQKAAIVQRIDALIRTKLPSATGIRHKGWLIVCEAQLLRIQKDTARNWEHVIAELKNIPNTCDRAFASAMVARAMWASDPIVAGRLFREAITIADSIPSLFHRVDMYQDVADFAAATDPEFAKGVLSRGVEMTLGSRDADLEKAQKNLIDSANVLSDELSSHLATMIDKDPARADAKVKAKEQLEDGEIRKRMLDESVDPSELFKAQVDRIPKSAWTNLGALNANRVEPVPLRHARDYISLGSMLPLSKSYPIFSWAIENAIRRLLGGTKEQARTTLRALFRATLQSCDLSSWYASKMSGRAHRSSSQSSEETSGLVQAGKREDALGKIRGWIAKNAVDYLKICDQFIGPEELLEILRITLVAEQRIRVYVVTSRKHQIAQKISLPWEDAYRLRWRLSTDQDPPDTHVIIAGLPNGDSPLHDRWWITKGAGLRAGTSFNSLGVSKVSELTPIEPEDLVEFESEIDLCLGSSKRGANGEKVIYSGFTL